MSTLIVVTIDGPAGAGKSTTARLVAEALGYTYIDTGAMYRAVTLMALRSNTPMEDAALDNLCIGLRIDLSQTPEGQRTFVGGVDVTSDLRKPEVTNLVSQVSRFHNVRKHMVQRQREMGLYGGIVMDGRDIGSVVFPNAQVKVFLVADLEERTRRRLEELKAKGIETSYEELREEIAERDRMDIERDEGPLVKPEGASILDTTHLTIDEQVQAILKLVHSYQRTSDLVSRYLNF
jgi:cytidylate kinase